MTIANKTKKIDAMFFGIHKKKLLILIVSFRKINEKNRIQSLQVTD